MNPDSQGPCQRAYHRVVAEALDNSGVALIVTMTNGVVTVS